ncbi:MULTISPECIES: hypothetical protein [unclassified Carboxylicivirga]|uniref:hypothetical protein n=1 Tax=Carboxylicivirga TaxID=1628153 RepID=UPI003D354019
MRNILVLILLMAIISCNNHKSRNIENKTTSNSTISKPDTINIINKTKATKAPIGYSVSANNCCGKYSDSIIYWFEYLDSLHATNQEGRYSTHNFLSKINRRTAPLFKTYISVAQNALLKDTPKLDGKFHQDTLQILDSLIVPFFNKRPFKVYIQHEMEVETQTLCCYKGKLRYFKDKQFIDNSKIKTIRGGEYTLYKGENLIIRKNASDSIHILPADYYPLNSFLSWSNDSSFIIYTDGYTISMFDIEKWNNSFLAKGKNPKLSSTNDSFIYYYTDSIYSNKTLKIMSYDLASKTQFTVLNLPDSLDAGCWGPDKYHASNIEDDTFNRESCWSVKLYTGDGDAPDTKIYKYYFNHQGDSLAFLNVNN